MLAARVGQHRRRPSRRRRGSWRANLVLLASLAVAQAHGAAFVPGLAEPDPPTGDVGATGPAAAELMPAGNGIQWRLAPWQVRGALGLDLRRLVESGQRHLTQQALTSELEFRSYVWQPWFIQLQGAMGALLSRDQISSADDSDRQRALSLTGSAQVSVFPTSRFPFTFSAAVGDSRSTGETLLTHYRTRRISLNQYFRPAGTNEAYALGLDHSSIRAGDGISDTVTALHATASRYWEEHTVDAGLNWSTNHRSDDGDRATLTNASVRHSYAPDSALSAETTANWSETDLRLARSAGGRTLGTGIIQVNSLAHWRPREGDWLYSEQAPATASLSARVSQSTFDSDGQANRSRAINLAAGITKLWSTAWRASGAFSFGRFDGSAGSSASASSATGSLTYSGTPLPLGAWRYVPSAGFSLSASDNSQGQLWTAGLQASHNVSRAWAFGQNQSLSFSASQSGGVLQERPSGRQSASLAHFAGLYWHVLEPSGAQTYVSGSVSESRSRSDGEGRYQFVNLQVSRRAQLSRFRSWSASLTAQASRSTAEQLDAFTGVLRKQDDGWQRFYSGVVAYQSQRFLDVPRLNFTAEMSFNSQQFERRSLGDIDAPLEQTTESAEARLDYSIGRLEARLSARVARIDSRTVAALIARVQRRF